MLRLLVGELRLQVQKLRLVRLDARLVDGRVDLGQQLALLDRVAEIDVELLELAGDLGADIDVFARLQVAERGRCVSSMSPRSTVAVTTWSGAARP